MPILGGNQIHQWSEEDKKGHDHATSHEEYDFSHDIAGQLDHTIRDYCILDEAYYEKHLPQKQKPFMATLFSNLTKWMTKEQVEAD